MTKTIKPREIKGFPISIKIGESVVTLAGALDEDHDAWFATRSIPFVVEGCSDYDARVFLKFDVEFEIVER